MLVCRGWPYVCLYVPIYQIYSPPNPLLIKNWPSKGWDRLGSNASSELVDTFGVLEVRDWSRMTKMALINILIEKSHIVFIDC